MSPRPVARPPRTYGNWRKARGLGIGSYSTGQTLTLLAAVLVPLIASYVSLTATVVAVLTSLLVVVAVVARVGGQSLADVVTRRVRFSRARAAGWTELSGGILTDHPRGGDMPGPMASTVPLDTDDGRGGRQGLLWCRGTGLLTAVLRVSPVGLDLTDQDTGDGFVAGFGGFLAELGYQPMVRHVAITVDTSPTGGINLRDHVNARIDPAAPPAARAVLTELVATAPQITAEVDTRVAISFDPWRATPRPQDLLGAVAEVTRWLPTLEASLSMAGVAVLGRADVAWLTDRLRVAYDPASRHTDPALSAPVPGGAATTAGVAAWAAAAPIRAREDWDRWWHESGVSVAWALTEAPRQAVTARALIPLLAPGPFARRVTLLYKPYSAGDAAAQVERQITNNSIRSGFARRTHRDPTQREQDDAARAVQAAREEAEGAGVGTFCFYVSTTVPTDHAEALLPAAVAEVDQRAAQAKLRLRRLNGAHVGGFAAALGLGINPSDLARRVRR